ncbi:ROK family protein [uncultured Cohaesibacter sp.]|uniref:ROK family protein n=1 Tax=uncultured Cohaesibacter sp. TaxID=1002546 RepID=UPI00292F142B|nr:ROK family protein [uncultured Cohaesibacter sp.]
MANVSDTITTDEPGELLRLMLTRQAAESATSIVAHHLVCRGAQTSNEIITATRLSRASVSLALIELRSKGIVIETNADAQKNGARGRGRPQMQQSIAPNVGFAAGVLLGLREIRILFSDTAHNKLADISFPIKIDYLPSDALELIDERLQELAEDHGTTVPDLLGIGLAVAAPVSPEGRIATGSIVPGWNGIDLTTLFASHFECPVYADNESNCAAQSKMLWGAARGIDDFVYVTFDYGIGGAIVFDGRVRRGIDGYAAEIGHIPVDHPGKLCRCGKYGCLETLATVDVVLSNLSEKKSREISLDELNELVAQEDSEALDVIGEAGQRCGQALAMISSILSPGHYLLDGIMTGLGTPFLDPLRSTFLAHSRGHLPEIIDATDAFDDTVRGAVGLVFSQQGRLIMP